MSRVQLNHLSGLKRIYVKLSFHTVNSLVAVRNELRVRVARFGGCVSVSVTLPAAADCREKSPTRRVERRKAERRVEFEVPILRFCSR